MNIYIIVIRAFFYKQRFFTIQPQCCLTFSWIEAQMLLRCCLIHKSIIILWHFLYLLYLCPFLDLGLFMLYYVIYFSFSFSFSVWLFVEDHERRRICSSAYFLEYFLFFWTLTWMKNVNNFRVAKVRPQHGVAYKAVPYIKKRVLTGQWFS